jgi:6-pyruvoyltetrahydropterin/6-carboxytetrahydropterin synthase
MKRFGIRVDKQYFNFGSAHFLIFEDGTREELHGHNYQVTVELDGGLTDGDVVLDFIPFKPIVKQCCDELDHLTLLPRDSRWLKIEEGDKEVTVHYGDGDRFVFPRRDVLVLPINNTSSERLAEYLAGQILERTRAKMKSGKIRRILVTVQESPGQAAIYEETLD